MNDAIRWLIIATAMLGLLGLSRLYNSQSKGKPNIYAQIRDADEKAKRR